MCEQGVLKGRLFNLSCEVKAEKLSVAHGELSIAHADGSKIRGSGGSRSRSSSSSSSSSSSGSSSGI